MKRRRRRRRRRRSKRMSWRKMRWRRISRRGKGWRGGGAERRRGRRNTSPMTSSCIQLLLSPWMFQKSLKVLSVSLVEGGNLLNLPLGTMALIQRLHSSGGLLVLTPRIANV
ncbi:hypothetical protein PoB_001553900 [Plakobranchus ocellatus]|uniref:Uncharacterized protein n=1 Tax=Plakobranchus ocellatus TaxID=259542 RepID=A0AAV3Z4U3_9GAST|nr:hypothetical protein PoB_001553900 [Plakobranchus ocellatus]